MPAEGVAFLTRGLNDLAAAIMYVCTCVWEYGTVRDTVCLVVKNSRKKAATTADAATCAPTTRARFSRIPVRLFLIIGRAYLHISPDVVVAILSRLFHFQQPPPSPLHFSPSAPSLHAASPLPPEIMVPQPSTAAPRNKLVIRRLPPTLPEDIFWQSVSTWITDKTCLWKSFVKGKAGDRSVASN